MERKILNFYDILNKDELIKDRLECFEPTDIVKLAKEKNLKFSVAESLTGGMLSSKIIDVEGAGEVFYEGVVTYANNSKINRLNVKEQTIKNFGAVSLECAIEMANGLLCEYSSIGVATTGLAGPGGASIKKPIGLTYISVAYKDFIIAMEYHFNGDRNAIRDKAVYEGLKMLFYTLIKY